MFYTVGLDSCVVLMVPPEFYKFVCRLTSCMRLLSLTVLWGPCWRHILVGQFDFHFCQILIWASFYATWEFPDHTRAVMKSQTYLKADYWYRPLGVEKKIFSIHCPYWGRHASLSQTHVFLVDLFPVTVFILYKDFCYNSLPYKDPKSYHQS